MHLTETHLQVRDMTRDFADGVIRPASEELDRDERFPSEIYEQMARLGLFGICVPEDLGGPGLDTLSYAIVMEELSRGYASVADQCGLVELAATLLIEHGTGKQREKWLEGIMRAETKAAYCITEAEAGTDVSAIRTTAARAADGWMLNGEKTWIHNAPVADVGFVLARTDPDAGHRGMSIFLVDLGSEGVSRGRREKKMGQKASPVGALAFENVQLPDAALLGSEGRGFHMMMSVLDKGRVGIAALAVGIAQAGLEAALEYARQRKAIQSTDFPNFRASNGYWPIWQRTSKPLGSSCTRPHGKSTTAKTRPWLAQWRSASPATWRFRGPPMPSKSSEDRAIFADSR